MKKISLVMLSALLCGLSYAEIKMPSVFSDNMLLQRDMLVKVWGKADANAQVDVAFGGQKKSTKADSSGNWSLRLDKMSANKNPQEMTVSENGKVGKVIKNILVGEVWVAGGQSNMQWGIRSSKDADKNIAEANNSLIRYFSQNTRTLSKTPAFDCVNGAWTMPSPKVAGGYSAVGYLFAKNLQKDLDVPVGIVFTALGGSRMVAWMPEDKIKNLDFAEKIFRNFVKTNAKYDAKKARADWENEIREWRKLPKEQKAKKRKPRFPNAVSYMTEQATPVYLYNAVVAPVAGYGARGVIWYQGESDANVGSVKYFGEQFELIVNSWREKFENPELAFIQVQLAQYGKAKSDWPTARWKQYLATKTISKCYMANIIDSGEKNNIHPADKQIVADRLERIALAELYGQKNVRPYGPIMSSVKYAPDSVEISFDLFGENLIGKGEARGFELKIGNEWKPAKAELVGKKVKVTIDGNADAKIEGVRYLWANWCKENVWLFNQNGLPALSFIHQK